MTAVWRVAVAGWVGAGVLAAAPAGALSMTEAIGLARKGDPAYRTALANLEAARARAQQAFGAALPQLSATLGSNFNRREYITLDSPIAPAHDAYNSKNAALNLTVPLIRPANNIAVTQAELAYTQMRMQLEAADQDLLVRLAQAWFDWMLARDSLLCAEANTQATRQQSEQFDYAGQLALTGAPTVAEARAKYDLALAEQAAAQAELEGKLGALEQVLGSLAAPAPPALAERFAPDSLRAGQRPRSLDQWLTEADAASPAIAAAKSGMGAAAEEIRKQRAGHLPTADLVANIGNNGQHAGSFPGQNGYDIRQRSIGIQVNIPLISGGTQSAKVDEALALRDKAAYDLELARRNARAAAKQAWFGWQTGQARSASSQQAVRSGRMALEAAEAGRRNDLKSPLDVLQARQQLLTALRDVQRAHYEMITSHLKLLASSGQLRAADLALLDPWLTDDPQQAALPREVQLQAAAAQERP